VLRGLSRPAKALALIAVESPLVLFFILFSSGMIPWPRSMLPHVAGSVLIAPLMIVRVDWLFRSRV
jgi:Periviscerokinin family